MPQKIYDWSEVQRFVDEGHGFVEAQQRFGFSHTAWIKAITRKALSAGDRPFTDRRRRYDWAAVQAYYDEGHTYRECRAKFGFAAESWTKAVDRGEVTARARALPIPILLVRAKSRRNVKTRLLQAGLLKNVCSHCGLTSWQDQPISMHLDHINGVRDDHRLENLRMLCPNCHSQTPTYGGRNRKRRPHLQDPPEVM
jgi:5-methylcytosine-specific restriction endonuclease McrA